MDIDTAIAERTRNMGRTNLNSRHMDEMTEIRVSSRARPVHPVVKKIAENLARIDAIRIVKVTPGFLQASSETSGARRQPIAKPGHPSAIGVSLLFDEDREEVQFYEITSAVKGYGSQMTEAVLDALPKQWGVFVVMDWSDGFWKAMRRRHGRIVLA